MADTNENLNDPLAPRQRFRCRFSGGRSVVLHEHSVHIWTLRDHRGDGAGGCLFLSVAEGERILDELSASANPYALVCRYLVSTFAPADVVSL